MDDLVQWLGAQLDEDERTARAVHPVFLEWEYDHVVREVRDVANGGEVLHNVIPEVGAHVAAHDPARVLSEIDAKRQAVRLYTEAVEGRAAVRAKMSALMDDDCGEFERLHRQESELIEAEVRLRFVVLWLAQPYADRPGYREEWRP
ncbi:MULTISPECIES: DUF6221 family protein [unclassified Streptomyces]|uniref:DUF6221 family protein n=1 Tax=unclassified Streptomyces TaxID=2593676 RepID=UPI002E17BB7B|nr:MULTISPECIES: DUF6221 family protein [unclassified Streptomyces]